MITQLRNKEAGFSLLELSVAVGVAAIVAAGAITATTAFIGGAAEKRDNYVSNAETSISNAESSSLALGAAGVVEEVTPFAFVSYDSTDYVFVGTFILNGVEYQLYNEMNESWTSTIDSNWGDGPFVSFLVNAPESLGTGHPGYGDGAYYWGDSASAMLPQGNPQVQPDGSVYYFDADNNFRGAVMYFEADPRLGALPAPMPE